VKRYIWNLLIAIDQLVNVMVCNGEPDETLSSAAYRMHRDGKPAGFLMHVINFLSFNKTHCIDAYMAERLRGQLAPEFRND